MRCVTAMLLSLLLAAADEAKFDLRPHFAKGDVHKMNVTLDQTIEQTVQGHKQVIRQVIGIGYTFTVTDVAADASASIGVRYESAMLGQKSPMGQVEYDSTKPPRDVPPAARGFAAIVGQSFTIIVSSDAQVTRVKGLDALLKSVLEKLDLPEGPAKAANEKLVRQMLSEPNVKASVEGLLAVYPGRPIGVGDTWTQKSQVDSGFPLLMDTIFTLKTRHDGIASVAVKATAASNSEAPPVDLGQAKLTYDFTGEQTGVIDVNESTGWLRAADFDQTLTGSLKLQSPNAPLESVPATVRTRMRMTGAANATATTTR